jgi:hypothetical protein
MRRYFFITLLLVSLDACQSSHSVPRGILPPEKMELVLYDLLRSGNLVNNFIIAKDSTVSKDQEHIKWINRVLTFHRVSEADFKKSFTYYQEHPELMSVMMDSISRKEDDPVIRFKKDTNYIAQ